jgi:ABC-type transport system substrate-binding protein
MRVRRAPLLASLVGVLLACLSATSVEGHSAPAALPVLRIAADTWYLDPALVPGNLNASGRLIVSAVYRGLVGVDEQGRVYKDLAATISVNSDRTRYVFTLRHAHFANGDPVTAGDVVFSIERVLAPSTHSDVKYYDEKGYAGIVGADAYARGTSAVLPGVKALSRSTVQITISRPTASFLSILASGPNGVLDPRVVRGKPVRPDVGPSRGYLTDTCPAARAAATGQLTFQCWGNSFSRAGTAPAYTYPAGSTTSYTLVPNPHYAGPFHQAHLKLEVTPALPLELVSGNTPADMLAAYNTGGLDVLPGAVPQAPDARVLTLSSGTTTWLAFNLSEPPFNNIHCRLAAAHALDRAAIASVPFNLAPVPAAPARTIVPTEVLPYSSHGDPRHDMAGARAELARCPNRDAPLHFFKDFPLRGGETQVVADQLRALGFPNVTVDRCETQLIECQASFSDPRMPDELPMTTSHLSADVVIQSLDYPDPSQFLSRDLLPHSARNLGGFVDDTFDRLVRRADRTNDRAERLRLYAQAQHRLLRLAAVIPLKVPLAQWTMRRTVHGLVSSRALGRYPAPVDGDWSRLTVR